MVMQWAISQQLRFDNPAGDAIAGTLPKGGQRVKHHKALPHSEVASVLQTLRAAKSSPATLLGLEFLVLTAARGGEAVGARWEEINMADKVWDVTGGADEDRRGTPSPIE